MTSIENSQERRKLQLTGGSTFVVSLPKKWIDELKMKIGDEVILIKNPNKSFTILSVFDKFETRKSIIEISKDDSEESLKRKIIAIYLAGYKIIEIISKGIRIQPNHTKTIRELVRTSMIGTEIVESSSESIRIQILTRLPELSFEVALRRMYLMASNMHYEAIDALGKMDNEAAQEVIKMDDEVDRFSLYMLRNLFQAVQSGEILLEIGLKKPTDCLAYRTVIRCIERIADHAVLIAKRIKFLQTPIDKKTIQSINHLSESAVNIFENSIQALTKNDYSLAEKVAIQASKTVQDEKEVMSNLKDSDSSSVIKFVLEDIRRTVEYSTDIAEVVINENIRSVILEK